MALLTASVNLTIKNMDEVQLLIERTEKATKELKECVWELSKVQFTVCVHRHRMEWGGLGQGWARREWHKKRKEART